MELRHLRYFVVVAEEEHFGRAAKKLAISQSPLSRQIAQLEAEIGTDLFTPQGRGVRLTDAGKTFLEGARDTLARADRAVADAREAAAGRLGTVTIGFEGGSAYTGMLPEVIAKFREKHPRVQTRLLEMSSDVQRQALRAGTIAVGFGYYAPKDDPEIRSRVFFRDRVGVILPRKHRLATKRTLRVRDLRGESFIWSRRDNPHVYDDVIVGLRKHGLDAPILDEGDGEAVLTLVAAGLAMTFLMESASILIRGRAIMKRVTDLGVRVDNLMMWRAADEESPLVRALLACA